MDNNPNLNPNPNPNLPPQSPQMGQTPMAPAPDVAPQPSMPAPMPLPTTNTSNEQQANPIIWIGIGFVAVAVIIYIITCFTDYSLPLNIIKFICALLGVIMAIVPATMKKVKWLDWRVMSAILLGAFIAMITGIYQTQHWILEDKLKNIGSGNSSQTVEYKEPTMEDVLNNDVDVTLGQLIVEDQGYGYSKTSLPVTIKNKSNERKTFTIEIEATAPDGTRIMTDHITASNLAPGQSVNESSFTYSDKAEQLKTATFKIIQAKSRTE